MLHESQLVTHTCINNQSLKWKKKKKKNWYGLLQLIEHEVNHFEWDKGLLFMFTVSISSNKNFIVSKCCVCMVCQSVCFHVFLFFHHVWCSTFEFLFKSMMCTIYQIPRRYSPWTSKLSQLLENRLQIFIL